MTEKEWRTIVHEAFDECIGVEVTDLYGSLNPDYILPKEVDELAAKLYARVFQPKAAP